MLQSYRDDAFSLNKEYEAEFLKQTGQLVTLKVLDNSGSLVDLIDDDSFALKMNLWRAPTDNDLGDTWVQLDEDVVPTHVKILAKTLKCVGFTPGGMLLCSISLNCVRYHLLI